MVEGVTPCLSSQVYSMMVSDGLPGQDTGPSGGGNSSVCVCVSGVALIPFIAELMEHEKCKLYPIPQINNIQTQWKCIIHSTGHIAAVDACLKCRDPLKP